MTRPALWVGLQLAAACVAGSLAAQSFTWSAGASVVGVRAQNEATRTAGTLFGGLASARFGRFEVAGRYMQGALQSRDLVQGQLEVRYAATPWLPAQTGARARAYVTPASTERWLTWLMGLRVDAPLVGTTVRGDVGLWRALALSASIGSSEGSSGRGGDAGITVQLPSRPVWVRLAYAIDRSAVASAGRRETVEEFTVTVGVRR
jgi:hypothetical protein